MEILSPFQIAFSLLVTLEPELMGIISLSLGVSLAAVVLSLLIGLPFGAVLAAYSFPGRGAIIVVTNTLLGMPPVVVGLVIYLLVSRAGPFGFLGILYTPAAMMLAQTILVLPIAIALSRQVFETLNTEYAPLFRSIGLGHARWIAALVTEARISLITIGLTCFGRAISRSGCGHDCRWQHPPFDTCNDNIDRTRHINGRVGLRRRPRHRAVDGCVVDQYCNPAAAARQIAG